MLGDLRVREEAPAPEALSAWRTWGLYGSRDGAHARLLPVAGSSRPWPVIEPARATCRRRHERVPDLTCRCGLHAMRLADPLRRTRDPAVVGTVALWGRIVEHEHGFRAELGYPQRLSLICRLCFWQRGLGHSVRPTSVVRHRGGAMVPLCEAHLDLCRRYAYPMPVVLQASRVESTLLDAYAVDILRVA
jgi:hypothetical protein